MNETSSPVRLRPKDDKRRYVGGTARRSSVDERHPGVDYRTSISMELLDDDGGGDVDVDVHEARNDELILRLTEVERIVADAQSYLNPSPLDHASLGNSAHVSVTAPSIGGNSASDIPAHFNNHASSVGNHASANSTHFNSAPIASLDSDLKDNNESEDEDEDELASDSPLRRRRSSSAALHHPMMRRDSSFGLHSPDVLPEVAEGGQNILDILRDMREAEEEEEAEVSVCLDPDLIDLTAIPPPATPEVEETTGMEEAGVAIDPPPGVFDHNEESNGGKYSITNKKKVKNYFK